VDAPGSLGPGRSARADRHRPGAYPAQLLAGEAGRRLGAKFNAARTIPNNSSMVVARAAMRWPAAHRAGTGWPTCVSPRPCFAGRTPCLSASCVPSLGSGRPYLHTLVDHIGAAADSLQRGRRSVGFRPVANLGDMTPTGPEPVEHSYLVRFAPRNEILKADVKRTGRTQNPSRPQQVQPGQMLTRQEVGYIAR
jgi:hypothetical protein